METYDLFMLLVLGALTLFGFWKGFAWQVAWLGSIVVSYFAALRFSDDLAPNFGSTAPWNRFVAMLAIFVGTSAAIWILFRFVSGFLDRVKLNEFDRQLGAILGFGRGVLWCIGITFFAMTLPWLNSGQKENIIASRSGQYIVRILDNADAVVPPEINQVLGPYITRVRQGLDPNSPQQLPLPNFPGQGAGGVLQDLRGPWQGQGSQAGAQPSGFPQQAPQNFGQQGATDLGREPRPFQPPYSAGQPATSNAFCVRCRRHRSPRRLACGERLACGVDPGAPGSTTTITISCVECGREPEGWFTR